MFRKPSKQYTGMGLAILLFFVVFAFIPLAAAAIMLQFYLGTQVVTLILAGSYIAAYIETVKLTLVFAVLGVLNAFIGGGDK